MKALVIYSSFSGRKGIEKKIKYINQRLQEKYTVEIFKSTHKNSMFEYVRDNGESFDLIVAVGGDGTIHDAINGAMRLNKRPTLAYVPAGTMNDCASTLGIHKRSIKSTMNCIMKSITAKIDVMRINDDYFVYGLAAGAFTEISYDASHKLKQKIGKLAYYHKALSLFKKTNPIDLSITIGEEKIDTSLSLLLALNTRYLAGFRIMRKNKICLNSGKINFTLIKKRNRLANVFNFGMFLLFGERYRFQITNIIADHAIIESKNPIAFNTDGELYDTLSKVEVSCINEAISVITTKKIIKKYFKN